MPKKVIIPDCYDPGERSDPEVQELLSTLEQAWNNARGHSLPSATLESTLIQLQQIRTGAKPAFFGQAPLKECRGLVVIRYYHNIPAYRQLKSRLRAGQKVMPHYVGIISRRDRTVADYLDYPEISRFADGLDAPIPEALWNSISRLTPAGAIYRILRDVHGKLFKHILLGRLYGYPECCIADFVNRRAGRIKPHPMQHAQMPAAVGHVRCFSCSRKAVRSRISGLQRKAAKPAVSERLILNPSGPHAHTDPEVLRKITDPEMLAMIGRPSWWDSPQKKVIANIQGDRIRKLEKPAMLAAVLPDRIDDLDVLWWHENPEVYRQFERLAESGHRIVLYSTALISLWGAVVGDFFNLSYFEHQIRWLENTLDISIPRFLPGGFFEMSPGDALLEINSMAEDGEIHSAFHFLLTILFMGAPECCARYCIETRFAGRERHRYDREDLPGRDYIMCKKCRLEYVEEYCRKGQAGIEQLSLHSEAVDYM